MRRLPFFPSILLLPVSIAMMGCNSGNNTSSEPKLNSAQSSPVGNNWKLPAGPISPDAAIPPLAEKLKDRDINKRVNACTGLGSTANRLAVRPLLGALIDPEPMVREAAEKALIALSWYAGPLQREWIKDKDSKLREQAAAGLGVIQDHEAVDALILALKDPEEHVRSRTALSLGKIGDNRAVPNLVEALKSDISADVQANAASALGSLKAMTAADELKQAMLDRKPPYPRSEIGATFITKDDHLMFIFDRNFANSKVDVGGTAALALTELGESSLPALKLGLEHSDPRIRHNALIALGYLKSPKVAELLKQRVQQEKDSDLLKEINNSINK